MTGPKQTHRISDLRAVRLSRGDGRYAPDALIVRLTFRTGQVALSSLSFRERLTPADQGPELSAFIRTLLAQASRLAPGARCESGTALVPGLFLGAVAILGAGILLVLLATVTAGAYALGAELAARLSLPFALMIAAWPWIGGLGVRRFDPLSPPQELLG